MIQLENDGMRWLVQPDVAPLLDSILRPGSPATTTDAGAEARAATAGPQTVKVSPAKSVTRHRAAGRVFYVKRYRHDAVPLRPWKFLFKPTQARQEWELAAALEARNVPIVRHVALGERHAAFGRITESVLITEEFPGLPLEEAPDTDPEAVLRFVTRLHEAGVLQHDLHPGNLLVQPKPLEIRLVDLHGTTLQPPGSLTETQRRRNLARLNVAFPLPVDEAVQRDAALLRRQLARDRSRRCLRHNREFAPLAAGGLGWWVRTPRLSPTVRRILEDPDGFLAGPAAPLKRGRSSTVGRADGLVLKRYNLRKAGNVLKDLFRPSKARRAYQRAYHLELAGLPTARIMATADRRRAGVLLRSYVLMEEIPGARELGAVLRSLPPGSAPDHALLHQTAQLLGALHREGFRHRDLKESNLVLDQHGHLHLLDLDGLEFLGEVPPALAAADLARFERGVTSALGQPIPAPWRSAFLRAYGRTRGRRSLPRP